MDIEELRQWIGREEMGTEELSVELVRRFEATFDRAVDPRPGELAPLLIHLCIAPSAQPMHALGRDGHPAKGGFLPPVPLPRRMWAGGSFTFHEDLRVGEIVTRRSNIRDVVAKTGRTGPLCFVTVEHKISAGGRAVLTERQDLVYRSEANDVAAKLAAETAPQGEHQRRLTPTSTLLFRYSSLTFNGHRIHYDAPYARKVEGYPGLVVHGPLLATVLCAFAVDLAARRPRCFTFRSLATLFDDEEIQLHAASDPKGLRLWAARPEGPVAMEATAAF
jgi:3-methylfumaryl-CoA hydratase